MAKSKLSRLFLTGTLCLSFILSSACSKASPKTIENTPTGGSSEKTADGGMTNVSGYPITKEPITLKAMIAENPLRPDQAKTKVLDYISENTNIKLEIQVIENKDKMGLLFASRDFPDIAFSTGLNANQLYSAAEAGDLVCLDDLIDKYSPTWKNFFVTDIKSNNCSLFPDGKRYTLPFVNHNEVEKNLRDQWTINKAWLDELGLKVPTTTDEFKTVLKAFKANAGKGSIPAKVVPYWIRMDQFGNGGQYDLYGSFGVYISDANYFTVEDGKVVYQGINPKIKEALKYLRGLYAEGLVSPEMFTVDAGTYSATCAAPETMVGSYHEFKNSQPTKFVSIPPLKSEFCDKPYIRRQSLTATAHTFMIFSANKYPVASMRLMEWIAETPENNMTISWGLENVFWKKLDNGKITKLIDETDPEYKMHSMEFGYNENVPTIKDSNFFGKHYQDPYMNVEGTRSWYYYNVYKNYIPPIEMVYVGAGLDTVNQDRMSELAANINKHRTTTFSNWITGKGDIDKDWDKYVDEVKKMGFDEYLALKVKAYDKANQKK